MLDLQLCTLRTLRTWPASAPRMIFEACHMPDDCTCTDANKHAETKADLAAKPKLWRRSTCSSHALHVQPWEVADSV